MIAPFIALNYQVGTPQMVRYAGASPAPVGNTFGTADTVATAANTTQPNGRIIQFGGLNTYLAATGNNIWRTTDGGTTWTSVYTFTGLNPGGGIPNANKSGFNIFYLNGIPAVGIMYITLSGSWSMFFAYSFNGITWTTVTATFVNIGGTEVGVNDSLVIGNTIFYSIATRPEILIALPGAATNIFMTPSGAASNQLTPSFCQFNNRVFILYIRTASTTLTLGEIVGQSSAVIASLDTGLTGTTGQGMGALFVDGVNMYAIARGSAGGYRAWQIDSALSVTEITSTVLPSVLTTASSQGGGTRMRVLIDGVSSPGSSPDIYLYYAASADSMWAAYQWNGNAAQITLITQGGSTRTSLPFVNNVTGSYFVADSVFPSTAGISVEITNRIFTATGVRLSFKIYGTSAGGATSFRVYVGDENAEYPTVAGTLTNPSVGAISGGNINTGLTADNGVTTYQVTWAAQTDGFSTNEQFRLIGDAFV